MPAIEITSHIIASIVVVSLFLWIGIAYRLWVMACTKPTILEGLQLPNPTDSTVSVVVPVHNEERVIDKCAISLRNQSHSKIQIIFVLDRCTDKTKEILNAHALEDSRICLIENEHCPDDWAGKCNAAHVGAAKATRMAIVY